MTPGYGPRTELTPQQERDWNRLLAVASALLAKTDPRYRDEAYRND